MIQTNDFKKIFFSVLPISLILSVPSLFIMRTEQGIVSTGIKIFIVSFIILFSIASSIIASIKISRKQALASYFISMLFAAVPGIMVIFMAIMAGNNMPPEPANTSGAIMMPAAGGILAGMFLGGIILIIVGIIISLIITTIAFFSKKE